MAKRGYKLQEFVAHASSVNCLSIGKKTSRLLVTGGEDHKVNLWAIGKPTSLMRLSGHTSSVQSVTFDSAEVLVVSGASTGAIKLWDLEEAKIVRTLTGHRSHCSAIEFHPFGEFFASGSSDTNLKIWDVRKKGCIHTYEGHTRGVSTIRFTPDGRWVVSGGADSVVKVWDLTAGKLLHEFKFHDGQIQCLDFHPLEFLLATGSADRTVNFWDLETFELIGSAGPEASGVRSMAFHPDGKTLFCGLEDSLKVFSWEPIICHDAVDMGWPTLGDLNIHDGKLLACSYYRNCVGVWVADTSLIGPYGVGVAPYSNGFMERKFDIQESHSAEKPKGLQKPNTGLRTTSLDNEALEIRNIYEDTSASKIANPKRLGSISAPKVVLAPDSSEDINLSLSKKSPGIEVHTRSNSQVTGRHATTMPVIVPRHNLNAETAVNSRRESMTPESKGPGMPIKPTHIRRAPNSKERDLSVRDESRTLGSKMSGFNSLPEPKFRFSFFPAKDEASEASDASETTGDHHKNIRSVTEKFDEVLSPDVPLSSSRPTSADQQSSSMKISSSRPVNGGVQFGRTRSLVERWEKGEICKKNEAVTTTASSEGVASIASTEAATTNSASIDGLPDSDSLLHVSEGSQQSEMESASKTDEDVLEDVMRNHDEFSSSLRSRLTKLQVVRHFWQRNDIKGGINAVGKLPDHYVQADVVSVLMEKMDIVTLDLFSCLLPMIMGLLNSQIDRHTIVSLEILLKLVAIFGPVVQSTMSASPSLGVDLQAERRHECCMQCFIHLQKIKQVIPSVIRRGGLLARTAQELSLVLRDI